MPSTEYAGAWTNALLLFSGVAVLCAVHTLALIRRRGPGALPYAIAAHMIALEILVAAIVLPLINPYKSAREFCAPIRYLAATGAEFHLYSAGFSREEYIFYAHRFHETLLMEPLDITLPPGFEDTDPLRLQLRLRRAITDAMEDLETTDIEQFSPEDSNRIRTAIDRAADEAGVSRALEQVFLDSVSDATARLKDHAENAEPALVMMRVRDYLWLAVAVPHMAEYRIVHSDAVGSREVVLLANEPAMLLLKELPRDGNA